MSKANLDLVGSLHQRDLDGVTMSTFPEPERRKVLSVDRRTQNLRRRTLIGEGLTLDPGEMLSGFIRLEAKRGTGVESPTKGITVGSGLAVGPSITQKRPRGGRAELQQNPVPLFESHRCMSQKLDRNAPVRLAAASGKDRDDDNADRQAGKGAHKAST